MAKFDVRDSVEEQITEIVFADETTQGGISHAFRLSKWTQQDMLLIADDTYGQIEDGDEGYLVISDKGHAQNLIKALNKAIELGWLK